MALMKPLSAVKPWTNEKKWEDDIEWLDFPDGKQILVRLVGGVAAMTRHWINTQSGKNFPMWCPQYISAKEELDTSHPCPAHDDFEDRGQKVLIGNCIVRSLQERGDENPVRGFMVPGALMDDFNAIFEIIKVDPADPEKGVDLAIKYNSKAVGNKKWGAQRGDTAPLTPKESKYRYFDFEKIAPNFEIPEVAQQYAKAMKTAMARNKYYVTQEQRIPEGARDPFKFFRGDEKGKPWHCFQELVDFKNSQEQDKAGSTHKVKARVHEEVAEPIKEKPEFRRESPAEEAPPPARAPEKADPVEEDAPPPSAKAEPAPGPSMPKGNGNVHPDSSIGTKEHEKYGLVPECFENYTGKSKCHKCPVRAKCIDLTDDQDDV